MMGVGVHTQPVDLIEELGGMAYTQGCDTLDNLPEIAVTNSKAIEMMILAPWRDMIGFVVQGGSAMQFPSNVCWGERTVSLSNGEMMQMRITPRGVIGQSEVEGVIVFSTRIFDLAGHSTVQTAFLWNPHSAPFPDPDLSGTPTPGRTFGCRNLHLLMPSLFHNHDTRSTNDGATLGGGKWPITDRFNYHSVKPSTFTVVSYECPSGTTMQLKDDKSQTQFTGICSTTPGLSTYVVAGALVGANVEDNTLRSASQVKYREWQLCTNAAMQQIERETGPSTATDGCNSALTLLDALSAEGIVGMLASSAVDGGLPENLHRPGGLPLMIATMMRICAHPEHFKQLTRGTNADQAAVEELNYLFESHDAPIMNDPERHWAIDIAIRRAASEARDAAAKAKQATAVSDNLIFIQRAGIRCATAIFGSKQRVDDPDKRRVSKWGRSSIVEDPLEDAKQRVMAKKDLMENKPSSESMNLRFASRADMRITLVKLMQSVEYWLRTGMYSGMQINKKNSETCPEPEDTDDPEMVALRIHNVEEKRKRMAKKARKERKKLLKQEESKRRAKVREFMKKEERKSFANMVAGSVERGEVTGEEVEKLSDRWSDAVYGNGSCDELSDSSSSEEEGDPLSPVELFFQTPRASKQLSSLVCIDAVYQASQALTSFFCHGSMVHQQLDVNCWLTSPHMEHKCADCSNTVHVLSAVMLECNFSHCHRCKRRRCLECRDAAANRYMQDIANKRAYKHKTCLRCSEASMPPPAPRKSSRK